MFDRIPIAKPEIGDKEIAAVTEVLKSGWLTQGKQVLEFEKRLAEYTGAKSVYCVNSATSGLFLALLSKGIGPGDEVIVPSLSFIATANCVVHCGATPVFADIDRDTINISPKSIRDRITPKTKAIIAPHQVGLPINLNEISQIARENDLVLIEDAACALGSTYSGKPIGSHSDFVVFSFHPRKILTTGEGGAVCYNGSDPTVESYLDCARKHGMTMDAFQRLNKNATSVESYPIVGYNFKMTDIQAAIGLVQLQKLEGFIDKRRHLSNRYIKQLEGIKGIEIPRVVSDGTTNYQSFLVRISDQFPMTASKLMGVLNENNISSKPGLMAIHQQSCYSQISETQLEQTDRALNELITLPLFTEMEEKLVDKVVDLIKGVAQ